MFCSRFAFYFKAVLGDAPLSDTIQYKVLAYDTQEVDSSPASSISEQFSKFTFSYTRSFRNS